MTSTSFSSTCVSTFTDIIWVIQGSSSVVQDFGMPNMTQFIASFAKSATMSPTQTRMGYLVFAGPSSVFPNYKTIH